MYTVFFFGFFYIVDGDTNEVVGFDTDSIQVSNSRM